MFVTTGANFCLQSRTTTPQGAQACRHLQGCAPNTNVRQNLSLI